MIEVTFGEKEEVDEFLVYDLNWSGEVEIKRDDFTPGGCAVVRQCGKPDEDLSQHVFVALDSAGFKAMWY